MANSIVAQIAEEGPRNAIVKITGLLDSEASTTIAIASFTNNDPLLTLIGFRLKNLQWSASAALNVNMYWNATAPQAMAFVAGQGRLLCDHFGGFSPNTAAAGFNGTINLSTTGAAANSTFTVIFELIKIYR